MSDKTRFYNMTKPIKHRRFKQMKHMCSLWCKALREQIHYSFNVLLYKLHYLDKYNYIDNTEKVIPAPSDFKIRTIEAGVVKATVQIKLKEEKNIHIEYFYRMKKGEKIIKYVIADRDYSRLFTISTLDNIHIKINKNWVCVDKLPHIKVAVAPPLSVTNLEDDFTKPLDYETMTLNTKYLQDLRHINMIGTTFDNANVSDAMLRFYYDYSCNEFLKILGSLTLHDLMM